MPKVVHDQQAAIIGQHGFDERLIVLAVDVADDVIESIPANDVEVLLHHLSGHWLAVAVADLPQAFLQGATVHLAVKVNDDATNAAAPRRESCRLQRHIQRAKPGATCPDHVVQTTCRLIRG